MAVNTGTDDDLFVLATLAAILTITNEINVFSAGGNARQTPLTQNLNPNP